MCVRPLARCQARRRHASKRLLERTGSRVPALVGLTLASQLMDDERCLEIAKALSSTRECWIVRLLRHGAALTATTNSWIIYNSWRRYLFRELMRYGALRTSDRGSHHDVA